MGIFINEGSNSKILLAQASGKTPKTLLVIVALHIFSSRFASFQELTAEDSNELLRPGPCTQ